MKHPNSLDLEAFACGDAVAGLAEHLELCPECREYVARAKQMAAPSEAHLTVARAKRVMARRFLAFTMAVAVPVAAAAGLLLVVRPFAESAQVRTTFKGGVQLAVIRERGGDQERFTSQVTVQPGDRLMLEVSLDREQAVVAALIGDDGSYVELMPAAPREAGTHLSERAARVDASPLSATVVVGPEADVSRARMLRRFDGVTSLRIEWEASP